MYVSTVAKANQTHTFIDLSLTYGFSGYIRAVVQNRIEIKPLGLNFSLGDVILPLLGDNFGGSKVKPESIVRVRRENYRKRK